jgi:hypothetical protein
LSRRDWFSCTIDSLRMRRYKRHDEEDSHRANERVALLVASLLSHAVHGSRHERRARVARTRLRRRRGRSCVAPAAGHERAAAHEAHALTPADLDVAQNRVEDDRR